MGELLRVVRDSHEDFNAVNIATAWSKLAKVAVTGEGQGRARSSDDIANIIQLLSLETPSVAGDSFSASTTAHHRARVTTMHGHLATSVVAAVALPPALMVRRGPQPS